MGEGARWKDEELIDKFAGKVGAQLERLGPTALEKPKEKLTIKQLNALFANTQNPQSTRR